MQRKLIYIVFLTIFLTVGKHKTYSQDAPPKSGSFPAKNQPDSTKVVLTELTKVIDSTKKDSVKPKKALLEDKI
ncbi:hypothetical protein, partial [Flavobacterium sp.]|uniref:hypothetical protein n=1 Tax=Flavobacterium sp. TaxID=239 RepID=UPI003784F1D6